MSGAKTENTNGRIIFNWWRVALADRQNGRARALAARLRRASPIEALAEPEVHDLAQGLGLRDGERLARLVVLLAGVREHAPQPLARLLGGADAAFSPLRFQRLMRASDEELPEALRRAIVSAGRKCDVAALGKDLLFWSERTRMQWCFQYYGAQTPLNLASGGAADAGQLNEDPSEETTE